MSVTFKTCIRSGECTKWVNYIIFNGKFIKKLDCCCLDRFSIHLLTRVQPAVMSHHGRWRVHADSATDSLRIKIKVTWASKSKKPQAWMKRHHPKHSSAVSQHTCGLCHGSAAAPLPFRLFVNGGAGPAPEALQNCWANPTFVWPGGCNVTWRHPAGLCGIWGRAQVHCALRAAAAPAHASWIILPCHLHCAQVWAHHTGILTAWGSVGERFSPG